MRVDFDGDAVLAASLEDLVDIDVIARTALKLATCHVTDDRRVSVFNGLQNSLGLFYLRQFEAAMDARDNEIELLQDSVRVIERAVRENICFNPLQDPEIVAVGFVQPVRLAKLGVDLV